LLHNGFSIGIGDTIADHNTMSYITQNIAERKANVTQFIDDAIHDRLKAAPGMTIRESFESLVERQLNLARGTSGQYAQKHLKEDNNVKQMVVAGSKGSFIDISQMSVCVGQQSVEGHRILFGFRHRMLPHFKKDDFSPESRGFVENSYLRGLVKALEDVMVCYDGTVRNSLGDLIQFNYGEDGMDGGAFIEKQSIETFGLSNKEFEHNYRVDVTDPRVDSWQACCRLASMRALSSYKPNWMKNTDALLTTNFFLREFVFPRVPTTQPHYLPVNMHCILQNAIQIFHIDRRKPSDLEPAHIVDSVHELGKRFTVVCRDDPLSHWQAAQANATLNFRRHLRAALATRHVLEKHHLTRGF
jgi:DNA-directed RNA polymerase II subunit RPB1